MKLVTVTILLLACGSGGHAPPGSGSPTAAVETESTAPGDAGGSKPAPPPRVDEARLRERAGQLAREAWDKQRPRDADGWPLSTPPFLPADFQIAREHGRWQLSIQASAGPEARVSFDERGEHPDVQVWFATE